MVKIKIFCIFILLILWSRAESSIAKSLSCSKNGTIIYFFDGDLTFLTESDNAIRKVQSLAESRVQEIDNKRNVEVQPLNLSTKEMLKEAFRLIKTTISSQKGDKDLTRDVSDYLFSKVEFCNSNTSLCQTLSRRLSQLNRAKSLANVSQWALWANKFNIKLKNGSKIVLITHGIGNEIFNSLYKANPLRVYLENPDHSKFFAHLQSGYSAISSPVSQNQKMTVASLDEDFSFGRILNPTHILKSRLNDSEDFFNNDFILTYTNESVILERQIAPQEIRKSGFAADMFADRLIELTWMLANNDDTCCNGRDGRFFRKSYDVEAGGFVEDIVKVDVFADLRIDQESSICGNFFIPNGSTIELKNSKINYDPTDKSKFLTLNGNILFESTDFSADPTAPLSSISGAPELTIKGVSKRVIIEGMPKLQGDIEILDGGIYGRPEITGKAIIHDSVITDANLQDNRLRINGTGDNGVFLYEAFVSGSPLLERNLTVSGATIEGEGNYRGPINGLKDEQGAPFSSIIAGGGTFEGTNDFAGAYLLQSPLKDSIIYNDYIFSPSKFHKVWHANQTVQRSNLWLKGDVTVLGNVQNGMRFESGVFNAPGDFGPIGININSASSLQGVKKINGPLFMSAAHVTCNTANCENINVVPTFTGFHSYFENSTITNVEVSNGIHIRGSTFNVGKVAGGSSVVFESQLNNVQVFNSSCVIGRVLSNRVLNRLGCNETIPFLNDQAFMEATKMRSDFLKAHSVYRQ